MTVTTGPSRPVPAAPTAQQAARHIKAADRKRRIPLLPALLFVIAMTQAPFLVTLVISFMNCNPIFPQDRGFTGFANYV